jgi:hypothetical protein
LVLNPYLLAAAMLATLGWAWCGSRVAMVLLLIEAVVWLHIDARFEGPTLLWVTHDHGLVLADLVAVAAVAGAAAAWRRRAARDRRRSLLP